MNGRKKKKKEEERRKKKERKKKEKKKKEKERRKKRNFNFFNYFLGKRRCYLPVISNVVIINLFRNVRNFCLISMLNPC